MLDKVRDDLIFSGFASEMRTIQTFRRAGWECNGSSTYLDKDERKSREIDVVADYSRRKRVGGPDNLLASIRIVGEVKKSDKPWVVFRDFLEQPRHFLDELVVARANNSAAMRGHADGMLAHYALINALKWRGVGLHESFKKPEAPSRCYGAMATVSKAAQFQYDLEVAWWKPTEPPTASPGSAIVSYVKPIVVLDGPLLAANVTSDGTIDVVEVEHAPVDFVYWSENYFGEDDLSGQATGKRYVIDLIRIDSLPVYLERCEKQVIDLLERMDDFLMTF